MGAWALSSATTAGDRGVGDFDAGRLKIRSITHILWISETLFFSGSEVDGIVKGRWIIRRAAAWEPAWLHRRAFSGGFWGWPVGLRRFARFPRTTRG